MRKEGKSCSRSSTFPREMQHWKAQLSNWLHAAASQYHQHFPSLHEKNDPKWAEERTMFSAGFHLINEVQTIFFSLLFMRSGKICCNLVYRLFSCDKNMEMSAWRDGNSSCIANGAKILKQGHCFCTTFEAYFSVRAFICLSSMWQAESETHVWLPRWP